MEFFNVGPAELILVLVIAILVAGPERMVEIARKLGHFSRQMRELSREFTTALQAEVQDTHIDPDEILEEASGGVARDEPESEAE